MSPVPAWAPPLETTRIDVRDGVAWLTFDRPDSGNARNQRMREELGALYDGVASDPDVRVLVLTGAGDRFFCAGMDLKEASAKRETIVERRERLGGARDIERLAHLPLPTVAAVNGYAVGAGCEMALACDLRVVADEARIGLPEVRHGLIPGGGGTQRLPGVVGEARAREMVYLARLLDGVEAHEWGLANRHAPRERLEEVVSELAAALAEQSPQALRYAKEALLQAPEQPRSAGIAHELDLLLMLMQAVRDERDAEEA